MKINPQNLKALIKQGSSNLVSTSRDIVRRFDPGAAQDLTLSLIHI